MSKEISKSQFLEKVKEKGMEEPQTMGQKTPFLNLYSSIGNWVFCDVVGKKKIEFVPRVGKQKGKQVEKIIWTAKVTDTNMYIENGIYAISPAGLLSYQLNEREQRQGFPFSIGIYYSGKDEQGRHQTEISDNPSPQNNMDESDNTESEVLSS